MSDFQFKFKRGTKEALETVNPILLEGEPCFELDTYGLKIGNGVSNYKNLPYSTNPEEIIKIINQIAVLVADDINKSVRTIANEELTKQLITENAQENLDTLQEIAQWIQNHPNDVTEMHLAISNLCALVGILPEDITATTVVDYIKEAVAEEKTRAELAESNIIQNMESSVTSAVNEALTEAKESGKFNGADGTSGVDGTSATHSWEGTVLTITSASGTSSADLKGEKGEQGLQGEQGPIGPQGPTGETGPQGDNYVLTDTDKSNIANMAAELVPQITVDSSLSSTSDNPISNKAVETALHSTEDKTVTIIDFRDSYVLPTTEGVDCCYMVRNGVCYVQIDIMVQQDFVDDVIVATLPETMMTMYTECTPFNASEYVKTGALYITGTTLSAVSLVSGHRYLCSFSYPVKY